MTGQGGAAVGCDPGHRETGIILRRGDECLAASIVTRDDPPKTLPGPAYFADVLGTIADYLDLVDGVDVLVAVEGVDEPKSHIDGKRSVISVIGLMGTAMTFASVITAFPSAVIVRPAGHGQAPIPTYPALLQPKGGRGRGHDVKRHCRSAFDIARAGMVANSWRAA